MIKGIIIELIKFSTVIEKYKFITYISNPIKIKLFNYENILHQNEQCTR